jgi:succinate dehydrogenase/fumarate reductase flavoprotein subunit
MVNVEGKRFVDEGQDFRNYTYAKFGRAILEQPNGIAFQIWDAKVVDRLRSEEYSDDVATKITAHSVEGLAEVLLNHGLRVTHSLVATVHEYNAAVKKFEEAEGRRDFNPTIKDGCATHRDLLLPKSNWALTVDQPPFTAVVVTGGITFTFGGLKINPSTAGVISKQTGIEIPGLFATGEVVGGLFYENYPGGSGLTAGAVFGYAAGRQAGVLARDFRA